MGERTVCCLAYAIRFIVQVVHNKLDIVVTTSICGGILLSHTNSCILT